MPQTGRRLAGAATDSNGASSEEIVEMLQGLYGALIDGIAA